MVPTLAPRRSARQRPARVSVIPVYRAAGIAMDTAVSLQVVATEPSAEVHSAMRAALEWFTTVERACSRFDPASELRQLLGHVGEPVVASPVLFEAARMALALARQSRGAFDPTVGRLLEAKGFNRHYITGEVVQSPAAAAAATHRDVRLGPGRTITLGRPLVLDLGAVAKGLAIDLAARQLAHFTGVCVEAGGDIFASGHTAEGRPWRVGIRDPRHPAALARTLAVSGQAVCTSGDYERRTPDGAEHHLVDARTGLSARGLASVTVVAPTAMVADGLATAAFVLGAERGLRLLERAGVGGILITPTGEVVTTGVLSSPTADD